MASLTSLLGRSNLPVVGSNVCAFTGPTQVRDGITQHRVFVYGTLKKGYGNHGLLQRCNAEFVGTASLPNYNMRHLGGFPAIYRTAAGYPAVKGEIYWVNADGLVALDRLEGVDSGLYRRDREFILGIGDCFVYVQPYPKSDTWECVANNDWKGMDSAKYNATLGGPRPGEGPWKAQAHQPPRPPIIPVVHTTYTAPDPGKSVSLLMWPNVKEADKVLE
jgi:gamma-glutamylcyclotransferase (GGCT)/AIG2-like uncharacterized protein YtfP